MFLPDWGTGEGEAFEDMRESGMKQDGGTEIGEDFIVVFYAEGLDDIETRMGNRTQM